MFGGTEFWVELIGYASIVSVAIFGLIAALSKEWDRRKEQAAKSGVEAAAGQAGDAKPQAKSFPWSYIAAIGIILSAVFAMTTNILQDWIDADQQKAAAAEALADRQEQDRQFKAQLQQLGNLDGRMRRSASQQGELLSRQQVSLRQQRAVLAGNRRLNSAMRTALALQAQLREQALQTIAGIEETRSQVNRGTEQTLRAMWTDSNRIDPPDIQVLFSYACPAVREDLQLFRDGAFAQIGLRRAGEVDREDFEERQEFSPYLAIGATALTALQQDSSVRRTAFSAARNDRMHMTRFSLFVGADADTPGQPFSDPEAWRNGALEVIIFARLERPEADLYRIMPLMREDSVPAAYSAPRPQLGMVTRQRISQFPCQTNLTVIVNGRIVVDQHPDLLLISGWAAFQRPTVLVRSYPFRIPAEAFPSFPAASEPVRLGTAGEREPRL